MNMPESPWSADFGHSDDHNDNHPMPRIFRYGPFIPESWGPQEEQVREQDLIELSDTESATGPRGAPERQLWTWSESIAALWSGSEAIGRDSSDISSDSSSSGSSSDSSSNDSSSDGSSSSSSSSDSSGSSSSSSSSGLSGAFTPVTDESGWTTASSSTGSSTSSPFEYDYEQDGRDNLPPQPWLGGAAEDRTALSRSPAAHPPATLAEAIPTNL